MRFVESQGMVLAASVHGPGIVPLSPVVRGCIALLERLTVSGSGGAVMRGNVAQLAVGSGPSQIDRYDRLRNANFEMALNGLPLGEVGAAVDPLPSLRGLFPEPMAVAVIGGLITSAFLSLPLISVVFTYVDAAIESMKRPGRRRSESVAPAGPRRRLTAGVAERDPARQGRRRSLWAGAVRASPSPAGPALSSCSSRTS